MASIDITVSLYVYERRVSTAVTIQLSLNNFSLIVKLCSQDSKLMKITSINIEKENIATGLESINLPQLDNIVILAGPNGAGKSRILEVVEGKLKTIPTKRDLAFSKREIRVAEGDLLQERSQIRNMESSKIERYIEGLQNQIDSYTKILNWNEIITDVEYDGPVNVVHAVPKSTNLIDYRDKSFRKSAQASQSVKKLGINSLHDGTLSYIKEVQTRAFYASHPKSEIEEEDKLEAHANSKILEELIEKFLHTRLGTNLDGDPLMFDKIIPQAGLSDGQKILLQLCVQIHAQGESLKNLIIMMDEPENHLHPAASIDLIRAIKEAAPDCQIWVATHSIPILSYFNDATLLFVENGKVGFSGSTPERVLESLVGDDERVQKIRDFTSLPSIYAMNRYAAECLLPPTVVAAKDKDDQTLQIQNLIKEIKGKKDGAILKVLDFGAGKGRLLESLASTESAVEQHIDYVAYDEFDDDTEYCKNVIETVYGESTDRYFSKHNDLTAKLGKETFDLIIMCNVLHEIDPKEWLKLFGETGAITSLLSKDGVLLLVEDEEIPVGEKAHTKGFIVFDTTELRTLFAIKEPIVMSDQRNDGRLKAHVIEKEWLTRITAKTRKDALIDRKKRAMSEIIDLRNAEPNYKNGRKHSFWVQQLANAELALAEL